MNKTVNFFLTIENELVEVFPYFENTSLIVESQGIRYSIKFNGNLKFKDGYKKTDNYTLLFDLKQSIYEIPISVKENDKEIFKGILLIYKGEWNLKENYCILSVASDSNFNVNDKILLNYETDYNLFEKLYPTNVHWRYKGLTKEILVDIVEEGLSDPYQWFLDYYVFPPHYTEYHPNYVYCGIVDNKWIFRNQNLFINGWIPDANEMPDNDAQEGWHIIKQCEPIADIIKNNIFKNVFSLFNILKFFVKDCCNVEITDAGVNHYCNYFKNNDLDLSIIQKSDVKRWNASNSATQLKLKLKQLLDILFFMFGLDWYVNANGYFQLIHPSEKLINEVGLNLCNYKKQNWSDSFLSFNDKRDKLYNKESWTFERSFVEGSLVQTALRFDGLPISYNVTGEMLKYDLQFVNNNISEVMKNFDTISDDGICVIHCKNNFIENYKFSDFYIPNGRLATMVLMKKDLTYNRLFPIGNFEYGNENINLNVKSFNEFQIKIPLDWQDIDVTKLVKTDLTDKLNISGAKIKQIEYSLIDDFSTITMEF